MSLREKHAALKGVMLMMGKALLFILIGYLSGSVLYAKVWGKLLCGTDITQ